MSSISVRPHAPLVFSRDITDTTQFGTWSDAGQTLTQESGGQRVEIASALAAALNTLWKPPTDKAAIITSVNVHSKANGATENFNFLLLDPAGNRLDKWVNHAVPSGSHASLGEVETARNAGTILVPDRCFFAFTTDSDLTVTHNIAFSIVGWIIDGVA